MYDIQISFTFLFAYECMYNVGMKQRDMAH